MAKVGGNKAGEGRQHKISHAKKVLGEQTIQEKKILPGMVVRFAYNRPKVYDRRPMVFVFQVTNGLIHGMNLNYLHESRVQKFVQQSQALTPMIYENVLKLKEEYPRLQLSTSRKASAVDGKLLYTSIMPRDTYYVKAYRTYKLSSAASMKLVSYDWDTITRDGGFNKTTAESVRRLNLDDLGD